MPRPAALVAAALLCGCGSSREPSAPPAVPRPGVHDHTPHHGGVVAMVGMLHLEARATRDGTVRVYVTDVWRRPLPLAGVTGRVTLELEDGRRDLSLTAGEDGALEASGPSLAGRGVATHVRLVRDGAPIEANFILPLESPGGGAAGIPLDGCRPAPGSVGSTRAPRCVMRFPEPVTTLATTADGSRLFVAGLGVGVSTWALPEARFAGGLAPPPPVAAPPEAVAHAESANAIAVRADGTEAVVGIEARLLVYSLTSGALARELPSLPGVVRSLAWSPDGRAILVSVFYDPVAHLLDAADGRERRRLEVPREAGAVAFAPGGERAAVGSETGAVALFDLGAETPRTVAPATRPIDCLGFASARILFPGPDGILAWSPATNDVVALAAAGGPPLRLAVSPDMRLVASADLDRGLRVRDAGGGTMLETLAWHVAPVIGLAWAGSTLVSADFAGGVALWDLADRLAPTTAPARAPVDDH